MRHLQSISYGFVGILYSRRLILLYSNHLEGRQTVENHHVHMGTRCTHVMMSSISIGFYFRGSRSVRENRENLHPAKISRYTVWAAAIGKVLVCDRGQPMRKTFSYILNIFATKKTKYDIIMTSQYSVYMRCVCVSHRGAAQLSGRGSPQSDQPPLHDVQWGAEV